MYTHRTYMCVYNGDIKSIHIVKSSVLIHNWIACTEQIVPRRTNLPSSLIKNIFQSNVMCIGRNCGMNGRVCTTAAGSLVLTMISLPLRCTSFSIHVIDEINDNVCMYIFICAHQKAPTYAFHYMRVNLIDL